MQMLLLVWASTEQLDSPSVGGVSPHSCGARVSLLAAALDDLASSGATGGGATGEEEPTSRARALLSSEVRLLGEQLRFFAQWQGA